MTRSRLVATLASAVIGVTIAVPSRSIAQHAVADAHPSAAESDAVLARRVTLNVDRVSLRAAVEALAGQANISIGYQREWLDATGRVVTLHAVQQPLGIVLSQLLAGVNLRVVVVSTKVIALRQTEVIAAAGTIAGIVTDSRTKRPIRDVTMALDDSAATVRTSETGHYRFAAVPDGTHRVTARTLGFARQTKVVTVANEGTAVADFALGATVNTLDQIVVTATGEQRVRELGHVVSKINADSLVKEAPITSLSQLLTDRVAGLAVYSGNGGQVGGDVALRLRSATTSWLNPQPIVIVDGVRYNNTSAPVGQSARPFNAEPRSPLNDLNVNDIESVEVVKGPSASTLYGPDASNGVIVIKTKRGAPGKVVWHVFAYPDLSTQPKTAASQATGYRAWGHNPDTGELYGGNCTIDYTVADNRQCVLDSITVLPRTINDPRFQTLAKQRPQWHYGANVSGGTSALTYFLSGSYDSETGALQVSPFAAEVLKSKLSTTELSDAIKNPNTQQTFGLHSNVSAQVNPTTTLSLAADYTQANQRAIGISYLYSDIGASTLPIGIDTTDISQLMSFVPTDAYLQSSTDHMNRIVASVDGTTHPLPWLNAHANVGIDLSSSIDQALVPAGVETYNLGGQASDYRTQTTGRSANLGVTALAHPKIFSFRTSVGTQYSYAKTDGLDSDGSTLAPGSSSIGTAQDRSFNQVWSEVANLGFYGEEVVGANDRIFLTGSLRVDGSSTFGDKYTPRPYPKVGASWILSEEPLFRRLRLPGLDEVRLRYSYGAASRYPTSEFKYGSQGYGQVTIDGQSQSVVIRSVLANPLIRPERTHESEWGADITIATNTQLGLTWYRRRTNDQLQTLTVPSGFDRYWANVGDVEAHGVDVTLSTRVFETRGMSLSINATYAYNKNKLLSLGSATGRSGVFGSILAGLPLDASYGTSIASVIDSVGGQDGIIEPSEVTLTEPHYLGVFYAPTVYTASPVLSLFGSRIRISSVFDRQSGGVQYNPYGFGCGYGGTCIAQYLTSTPLMEQANLLGVAKSSWLSSSDFTRWREASVTGDIPTAIRQKMGLSRASVSLQCRNLMLWTKYNGPDPESVPGLGISGYNSAYQGATGIPQARSWTVRFDLSP